MELVEQRLCLLQDRNIDPFRKPTAHRRQHITGLSPFSLV